MTLSLLTCFMELDIIPITELHTYIWKWFFCLIFFDVILFSQGALVFYPRLPYRQPLSSYMTKEILTKNDTPIYIPTLERGSAMKTKNCFCRYHDSESSLWSCRSKVLSKRRLHSKPAKLSVWVSSAWKKIISKMKNVRVSVGGGG